MRNHWISSPPQAGGALLPGRLRMLGLALLLVPALALAAQPPTVTQVEPRSGPPGTRVTLTGTGLAAAASVMFFRSTITDFEVKEDTKLVFRMPASGLQRPVEVSFYLPSLNGLGHSEVPFRLLPGPGRHAKQACPGGCPR
jgi:hypothetical protein